MPHHHHGPGHGPHHGPHRGRIVAHSAPGLARDEYAGILTELGSLLEANATVVINDDVTVPVPSQVQFELVYERTPHGSLALVLRAEWPEVEAAPKGEGRLRFSAPGLEG